MTSQTIPSRKEIALELTWELETVYATKDAWEKDFLLVESLIPQIESLRGTITETANSLLKAFRLYEQASQLMGKLYVYANMRYHEDTTKAEFQALSQRADSLSTKLSAASSFFNPELSQADNKKIENFLETNEELKTYRHLLDNIFRQKKHLRSSEIEEILALASEIAQAPADTFQIFNNADLKLPTIKNDKGEEIQLTQGNFAALFLSSKNREVRKAAFEAMFQTYENFRNTLATTYGAQIKQNIFFAKQRYYNSSKQAALTPANISEDVYDTLLNTTEKNLEKLHKYLNLRKRLLGLPDLHFYDLYVPIVDTIDYKIEYKEAKAKILEALAPLGEDYVKSLKLGFDSRWIDVCESKGKLSGAYSWGAYGTNPFMLLNWQGTMDSMFTLAHEAGHSMHSFYTRKNQSYTYGNYTLFVAEVASIFNEMLLTSYLLKNTDDPQMHKYIINHALDEFRTTFFRQALFAEFESKAHSLAEQGQALTADLLSETYRALIDKYYGAAMKIDDLINIEWARIPHFYSSFYVYQYATGISAAVALSKRVLEEGKNAQKDYLKFLASGSSKYSIDLLKDAGVDFTSGKPVDDAMQVFNDLITKYESLLTVKAK